MNKSITKVTEVFSNIVHLFYKNTPYYQGDQLKLITFEHLQDINLFRPTADWSTIIDIDYLFGNYSTRHCTTHLIEILNKIIIKSKEIIPDFDFYKIQSLTASKSFGQHYNNQINGSWFNSVYEWGAGMYPDKNLKAENIEDWKRNIYHIEREGFCRNSPLRITYYEWVDRYVASNSGGSHHAAMVVYQSIRDKLEYRREAEIEIQTINNKWVNELDREYYSFIVKPKKKSKSEILKSDFIYALRQVLNCKVNTLIPVHYCSNVEFIFIRKQDLNIDMKLIESWLEYSKKCGKIILLAEYLTEPLKYHTKQYHHDLGRIYLGDPCREYKKT